MHKLIEPITLELARMVGLVRGARPVQLDARGRAWGLMIEGRGFRRVLKDEILRSPNIMYAAGSGEGPRDFWTRANAAQAARRMGLKVLD